MKKRHYALIAFLAVLLSAYTGLWIYSAQWFKREIDRAYANAEKDGVVFLGEKPVLSNFPFVPEVYYTGGIQFGNIEVLFPELKLRGYPLIGTTLRITAPKGISLGGIVDPVLWSLDSIDLGVAIPYSLPEDFTYESLAAWKEHNGKIDVRDYTIKKQSLNADGRGLLTLDDNLQPVFELESTIRGHESFIQTQSEQGVIEPFAAMIATGLLNSLAKDDPQTGQRTVTLRVNVRNRTLYVGPLQVLSLPEILWDRRSPPAPHL